MFWKNKGRYSDGNNAQPLEPLKCLSNAQRWLSVLKQSSKICQNMTKFIFEKFISTLFGKF